MSDQFQGGLPPRPVQKPVTPPSGVRPPYAPSISGLPPRTNQGVQAPPKQNVPLPRTPASPLPPRQAGALLPPRMGNVSAVRPQQMPSPKTIPINNNTFEDAKSSWINPQTVKHSQNAVLSLMIAFVLFCAALVGVLWFVVAPPSIIELATPIIVMNEEETKISWTAITNARWYEVFVNNKFEKNTLETEFVLADYSGTDLLLSYKVRASKNGIYSLSKFSNAVEQDLRPFFTAPDSTIDEVNQEIVFAVQENVTEYEIFESEALVQSIALPEDYSEEFYTFSIANFLSQDYGQMFEFKVRAKANLVGKDSDFSVVTYDYYYTIPSPQPSLESVTRILSWARQNGASVYEVVLDDNISSPVLVENTLESIISVDLNEHYSGSGFHTVSVRSIGKDEYNINSVYSEEISFFVSSALIAPTNLAVNMQTNMLTWTSDGNSETFTIKIDDDTITTIATASGYDLSGIISQGNIYYIYVRANAVDDYFQSAYSELLRFVYTIQLSAPQNLYINVSTKLLSWTAVTNASSYSVYVDGTLATSSVSTNAFSLESFLTVGKEYSVYVKANGASEIYVQSIASDTLYHDNKIQLATPQNVAKSGANLVWDLVSSASTYDIDVYLEGTILKTVSSSTNSVAISSLITVNGNYYFFVIAVPAVGERFKSESEPSTQFDMVYSEISAPTGLSYNKTTKVLSWDNNLSAGSYTIALNNSILSSSTNSINLTSTLASDTVYQAKVKAISGFDGKNSEFCSFIMFNNTVEVVGYTDEYFFFEQWNDYKITSTTEMNIVTWYARTLQLTSVYVHCTYTPTVSYYADFTSAIGSFGETAPPTSYGYSGDGTPFRLILSYNNDIASEVGENIPYAQSASTLPRTVALRSRDDSFDDFYVNNNIYNEVYVQNSDHLFLILQSNSRPIFETGTTNQKIINARTVYSNILQILREIINSDYTEFEKVVSIFDWLVYNGYYDAESLADSNVDAECGVTGFCDQTCSDDCSKQITEHNCFFLEGMFLNSSKRLPVCDAFAKAFTVMCRIEGIEAIKVTGNINGGGHAWNKVNLMVPGTTQKNWFFVDPTWDNNTILNAEQTEAKEILTHSYFLITDAMVYANSGRTYTANARMYNPACTTSFNVFDYLMKDYSRMTLDSGNDCSVNNLSELTALFDYLGSIAGSSIAGLEIMLNYTYSSLEEELSQAVGGTSWTYSALPRAKTCIVFRNGVV